MFQASDFHGILHWDSSRIFGNEERFSRDRGGIVLYSHFTFRELMVCVEFNIEYVL